ncbi:hypothetical protein IW262DRAFT_1029832 [Armillaria fumosa]|nr:hypothetical protein IW262DRAFT_1029832 [Armillaria fumosa]
MNVLCSAIELSRTETSSCLAVIIIPSPLKRSLCAFLGESYRAFEPKIGTYAQRFLQYIISSNFGLSIISGFLSLPLTRPHFRHFLPHYHLRLLQMLRGIVPLVIVFLFLFTQQGPSSSL